MEQASRWQRSARIHMLYPYSTPTLHSRTRYDVLPTVRAPHVRRAAAMHTLTHRPILSMIYFVSSRKGLYRRVSYRVDYGIAIASRRHHMPCARVFSTVRAVRVCVPPALFVINAFI